MSDAESVSWSEISEGDKYEDELPDFLLDESKRIGRVTIPLAPQMNKIFKNCFDNVITAENRDTFEQTEESVLASVSEWGPSISYVRDEFIDYNLCSIAISNHDGAICGIKPHLLKPDEYYDLCLESVSENGWNMKYIPKQVQTQELCDAAIKSICWAIQFCKDKFKTYDNCFSAVKRNGQCIEHVPNQFIDEKMSLIAVQSRYPCLELIQKEYVTQELCEEAVKANGENIRYVPEELMTMEMAETAIRTAGPSAPSSDMAGINARYLPKKFLTKEIIVEASKNWFSVYQFIPKECLTEEIENAVLDVSPICIRYMEQTPEKKLRAVKADPMCIRWDYIAEKDLTPEIAEYVLSLPDIKNKFLEKTISYLESLV